MAIFNSYIKLPEGIIWYHGNQYQQYGMDFSAFMARRKWQSKGYKMARNITKFEEYITTTIHI